MKLLIPIEKHLLAMMDWFSSEDELLDWSGPHFRYPYNVSSFVEDLNINQLNSFSLISSKSEFLAFGQYYQRLGKCHLGRLIVNPQYRGKGFACVLIQQLSELGMKELEVKKCSLFVLAHNKSAIRAYEKYGFSFAHYPDEIPLEHCLYMVK